jgi:hypothetical protein
MSPSLLTCFACFVPLSSVFLPPFSRRGFGFRSSRHDCLRYYEGSDCCTTHNCRTALSASSRRSSIRAISKHLITPGGRFFFLATFIATSDFAVFAVLPMGSTRYPAEASSLSYGPNFRFLLLSTLPRGSAVTLSYGGCSHPRHGLSPCWSSSIADAREGLCPSQTHPAGGPGPPRPPRQFSLLFCAFHFHVFLCGRLLRKAPAERRRHFGSSS